MEEREQRVRWEYTLHCNGGAAGRYFSNCWSGCQLPVSDEFVFAFGRLLLITFLTLHLAMRLLQTGEKSR
jgi:hypothetical protein